MVTMMQMCMITFYCEGIINTISGIMLMLFPYFALDSFGVSEPIEPIAADMLRWFGSVVIILGWIGLFSPVTKGRTRTTIPLWLKNMQISSERA